LGAARNPLPLRPPPAAAPTPRPLNPVPQQSAVKTVDTASLDKAIQLFSVENGRNPKDLNELVEQKFIPRIPETPFGTKLVYDSGAGTVKIVSQ
jgi:hypothetical protein